MIRSFGIYFSFKMFCYFFILHHGCQAANNRVPLQIGVLASKFVTGSKSLDTNGQQALAAIIMAINEINNKTDHVADDLLPNHILRFAFRSPSENYLQALNIAQDLAQNSFDGSGIVGLIGGETDITSEAFATIFSSTANEIPQISYGATASDLGHKIPYPYFLRTCSSSGYVGVVLARFIYKYFGWTTVTVFSSGDLYGTDALLEFTDEASRLGVTIESKYSFWSGIGDFSGIIKEAINNGGVLKIFVLLMKSADAGPLLEQGYDLGLFKAGTQILGTKYLTTTATWQAMSANADVKAVMKGVIGAQPTITSHRTTANFAAFVRRWRAQKSTLTTSTNGTIVCNRGMDDDGTEYLYVGKPDLQSTPVCTGLNFQSFSADGSDIVDMALYAYDATYALAYGLNYVYNNISIKRVPGPTLLNALLNNVSFEGAGGPINFFRGGVGFDSYGRGDRKIGLEYTILNFNPANYHADYQLGAFALTKRGSFSMDTDIFTPCNVRLDITCGDSWIFSTTDGSVPIDVAPILEKQMPPSMRAGLQAGASIVLAITVFYGVVIYTSKDHKIIKFAQPGMLYMVITGALIACVRVYVATLDITNTTCIAGKWLGHLSFVLVFTAMILKTWRVGKVVNSKMKRIKISNRRLQLQLFAIFLLFCIYLLFTTVFGSPHKSYEESFDGHFTIRLIKCEDRIPELTYVLFAFELAVVLAGAKVCWETKDAPDAVNDAKYIAMCKFI